MEPSGSRFDVGPVEIVFLALTLLLAGIHLYLGLLDPVAAGDRSEQFIVIGLAFVAGFVARLTSYWRPLLYLLGAAFAVYLGALWLLGGTDRLALGLVTGAAATVFILLALYLFVRDESEAVEG